MCGGSEASLLSLAPEITPVSMMRPGAVEVFAITSGFETLNLRQDRIVSFCRPTGILFLDTRAFVGTNPRDEPTSGSAVIPTRTAVDEPPGRRRGNGQHLSGAQGADVPAK
jgi:hypothetical protein